MALIFLLLIHVNVNQGQSAGQEAQYGIGVKLCNLICSQTGSCMSFAYDIDRLACHLSHKDARRWVMRGFAMFQKKTTEFSAGACSLKSCKWNTRCMERRRGDAVCVEDHTVISILDLRCFKDSDCPPGRKLVCFSKTCKCTPGYSFNPVSNRCVKRCDSYGTGFMKYQGLGIAGHNKKAVYSISQKECCEICAAEKSFTCITFDYGFSFPQCLLSSVGYLDVSTSDRETEMHDWIFAVRNCE